MELVGSLRQRLSASTPAKFECGLCTASFDYRPPNCPACGSTEIRET
ncbi:hypothetical protein HALDL1_05895 [Halobacterium sp. DL1]|jgi:primosomal protein N'|nr:hypothetical protein HALDL1_05895 [Halobacterium sp. DL1]